MITDTLKSIYLIADKIYSQVKLAKANQAQSKTLAERVSIIVHAVKKLESVKDAEQYLPGLQF